MAKMELDDSLGPGPRPGWWVRSRRRWALSLAVISAAILLPLLWVVGSATAGPDSGTVVDLPQHMAAGRLGRFSHRDRVWRGQSVATGRYRRRGGWCATDGGRADHTGQTGRRHGYLYGAA